MRGNLEKTNQGEGVRALGRLRCGNMEEWNKYWLEEGERRCIFCDKEIVLNTIWKNVGK